MNTTQYKGFTILFAPTMHGGTVSDRYNVLGDTFNPDGYPTANHAKGAITKHLKAVEAEQAALSADFDTAKESLAAKGNPHLPPVADVVPSMASVVAAHIRECIKATPSRNKREGRYTGNLLGKQTRQGKRKPMPASAGYPVPSFYAATWAQGAARYNRIRAGLSNAF